MIQSLSTNLAPCVTASFSAAPRSEIAVLFASTRRMWHSGQIAEIISMLSAAGAVQPAAVPGRLVVLPVSLTCSKHLSATVQAVRPYWVR